MVRGCLGWKDLYLMDPTHTKGFVEKCGSEHMVYKEIQGYGC